MSTPPKNDEKSADEKKKERSEKRSEAVRTRLKESMEHAEEERKRELFRRRIDLAKKGVEAFEGKRHQEAAANFHTYIRILEDWKGTQPGGLLPSHFEKKSDLPELTLITGVYWDLVKLYDRAPGAEKKREFMHYLEKYLVFSKGMPYHALSKETLRKYINIGHPKHAAEFKHAYKLMGGSNCYVVTALSDLTAPDTLTELRSFRDEVLERVWWGKLLSKGYYHVGPKLADWTQSLPRSARMQMAKGIDRVAVTVRKYRSDRV